MRYVLGISFSLVPVLGGAGCVSSLRAWQADGWYADYEAAEHAASETGREMLISYRDDRPGHDVGVTAAMHSPKLPHLTHDYACCELFRSYEPDRRYVGQFGVDRAPALILVRSDGTYHAMLGTNDVARIETFLANAQAPGKPVRVDPFVPRETAYDWHDSLEAAASTARETGRPLFVVYYRTLSRDWSRLSEMLDRPEVSERLTGAVPVRIGLWGIKSDAYVTRFGALSLPALVLVRPDGGFEKLELPKSYEDIVRFIDAAPTPATAGKPSSPAPVAAARTTPD